MKNTLKSVTLQLNDTVEFGLILYPAPEYDSFDSCHEGTMQVQLGPQKAWEIADILDSVGPNGNTPTAASLRVAAQAVQPYLNDGRPISVLLATDGAPNCRQGCSPGGGCPDTNATFQAAQALRDTGVLTYVVGVPSSDDDFTPVLNQLANIGGTALPGAVQYYDAVDEAALQTAIDAIVERIASCRVDLDQSLYSASSVTVTLGGNDLPRDTTRTEGWDIVSTYSIELYGQACSTITNPDTPIDAATIHVSRCEEQ
jgi:hypothetical protein